MHRKTGSNSDALGRSSLQNDVVTIASGKDEGRVGTRNMIIEETPGNSMPFTPWGLQSILKKSVVEEYTPPRYALGGQVQFMYQRIVGQAANINAFQNIKEVGREITTFCLWVLKSVLLPSAGS